jgi:quercetin dioxygenase-like cupin family protein
VKRNSFLKLGLALGPLLSLPLNSLAKFSFMKRTDKGFKVKSGEGRIHGHITLKGINENVLDVKISGTDTDGGYALFEQTSLSPKRGTPLHVHPLQDETFYVVEGTYKFKVGDELFDLETGDSIFLPKNVPHAWTQMSGKGKMVVLFQPAGKMEAFFVALAAFTTAPTKEQMAKLFEDNEMKIVGPPLNVE